MTERKNHRMDAEGKRLLEAKIDCIVQRMPQWGKYIPKNDEIRKQITAIFHAVSGYVANGIVSEDCLQKISAAVAQYDIFSGKSLGWAINVQGDFSLADYLMQRTLLRSVEKNVCLLIAEIDNKEVEQKANKSEEELKKKRKHRYETGEVKQAYESFKTLRKGDAISFRTFQRWVNMEVTPPKGFPGISNYKDFLLWVSNWDGPERKKAKRHITGMSEEEVYRKRYRQ